MFFHCKVSGAAKDIQDMFSRVCKAGKPYQAGPTYKPLDTDAYSSDARASGESAEHR